nr:hypothetical protein [Nanoarchaeota archaeon]
MVHLPIVPEWFLGYDIILELAFAIITLIVSIYAFKIYKLSGQRQSKFFGIAFLFISIAYFIQSFLNFVILSKLNENICRGLKIASVNFLNSIGIYAYIIFFGIGLITLTYMTLRIKSAKIYSLLLIIILLSFLSSSNTLYLFYLLSSVLLIYIFIHYLMNYLKNKQAKTLLVLVAFAFLLFGSIHFIFSVNHGLYYVIGHFLELIAYLFILINLILVVKK